MKSRDNGGDGRERTAILRRRFRLGINEMHLRRPTIQMDIDHRLLRSTRSRCLLRFENICQALAELVNETASKIMFPMFLVAGIAGGAMVGLSGADNAEATYNFQQTWLSVGGAIWILVLALTAAVYPPSWLRLFNIGDDRKQMLGGILHLSLAVMLVLMTWKFGV